METHYFYMFGVTELGNIYNVLVSVNMYIFLFSVNWIWICWSLVFGMSLTWETQISYLGKLSAFYELDLDSGR